VSILRKLRESRRLSLEGLADKMHTSSEEIYGWEEDPRSIEKNTLSKLAYYYGLGSEELVDAIEDDSIRLTSSSYYLFGSEGYEDGWWGHFGVRLRGHKKSKWFPITLGVARGISSDLMSVSARDDWVCIETLNNRVLVFRPSTVNRVYLLDEAADQPGDDWEVPWDGYSGQPGEFYRALEEYYWEGVGLQEGASVADVVKRDVEIFTDLHDLDLDQVRDLIIETKIYNTDGSSFSHDIDDLKLIEIIERVGFGLTQIVFDISNDNFDLYISAENVSLIDMPRRRVDMAFREHGRADGGEFDEN
jgi:transcriptional regulator with XRE-family HTH domain